MNGPAGARRFHYVGPADLLELARQGGPGGFRAGSPADLDRWLRTRSSDERAEPFTYVVPEDGVLRLAPRRSEHVACAAGQPVLAAGEMSFRQASVQWAVADVSNQSTGYCPDLTSWPAVAAALRRAGVEPPPGFTHGIVFRRCPACGQVNLVPEDHFVCVFCDAELPATWNVDDSVR